MTEHLTETQVSLFRDRALGQKNAKGLMRTLLNVHRACVEFCQPKTRR
jgi:hypothetical protein